MYYVYRHVRLDKDEPFYIGMAKKIKNYNSFKSEYRRAFDKRRNKNWVNIINFTDYIIDIIYETDSVEEVISKEKEFIKIYGRSDLNKGSLVNYTDGGEGVLGYKFTKEHLKKLSESHKGQIPWIKGKKHSKESKRLMSLKGKERKGDKNGFFGKSHSEEFMKTKRKPVGQYDMEGNLIQKFISLKEAADKTESDFRLISAVCWEKRKSHNGFKWKFI